MVTTAPAPIKAMIGYLMGGIWTPRLDSAEGLGVEFQHYVHCLETGWPPKSDGLAGLRVVRILEAASGHCRDGASWWN